MQVSCYDMTNPKESEYAFTISRTSRFRPHAVRSAASEGGNPDRQGQCGERCDDPGARQMGTNGRVGLLPQSFESATDGCLCLRDRAEQPDASSAPSFRGNCLYQKGAARPRYGRKAPAR